jgi:hypothetical protein
MLKNDTSTKFKDISLEYPVSLLDAYVATESTGG